MREQVEVVFWQHHHIAPHLLLKFSYFVFFTILVLFLYCCLETFSSYEFFKLDIPGKIWMSNFHRLWPCWIWSYVHQDIASRREVTQYRKFYDTFLEKFIYLNLWQISSSAFYERQSRRHTSILFKRITPIVAQLIQFFA